jgi:creatinine amidohydrolase
MIALINTAETSPRVRRAFFADAQDWHANAAETSLMLARAPHLVRRNQIKKADDPDRTGGHVFAHPVNRTSANGVTGYPSRAKMADGDRLFRWIVTDLSKLVRRGLRETPPLTNSYFKPTGLAKVAKVAK